MIETAGTNASAPSFGRGEPGGLTAPTAIVLVTVVTVIAAVASAATGHGFGAFFNAVYLVAVLYVALRVHIEDRFVAVVAPPIIYAVAVFIAGFFDSEETSHAFRRVFENTFVNVSLGAPWLVIATVASIVIAVVRGRRASVARRR